MARRLRVYVDTSVVGGTGDEEFAVPSRQFFDQVTLQGRLVLVSELTLAELDGAPEAIRRVLRELPSENVERLDAAVELEAQALAAAYLDAGVVGPARRADALHVAMATVGRADVILSWNFKHIVRLDRIRKFNGVNALLGYGTLDIRSPLELGYGDEDEDL